VNFDGLVGPTHNYAGLARGNLASQQSRASVSNPREAALQALAKMKLLMDLGVAQAVLPPQERPDVGALRRLGFSGSDERVLEKAHRESPQLLAACGSASSMWAANAATVSPSPDTADGRLHLTPANLANHFHRALETPATTRVLQAIFRDPEHFAVHEPLPSVDLFCDEGAANHTRLAAAHGNPGVELLVFGRTTLDADAAGRFRGRQTLEASRAIARLHGLDPSRTVFARQHPDAIDAGVFHNDVIAVGNLSLFLCHARAFVDQPLVLDELRRAFARLGGGELTVVEVADEDLSLSQAVATYLFNSQLVTVPNGSTAMICPAECRDHLAARRVLDRFLADGHLSALHFVDVRQSMRNGGGPACLRLRVVLTPEQQRQAHGGVFLTPSLHARLVQWVERHYRDHLAPDDLADPRLLEESRAALDVLTELLDLHAIYPFQGSG
jgi:succinylarginine dihydrolase